MFSTPILLLATIQVFLLMDRFEQLLAWFRLGRLEITAIFELRCLIFIKFGKYIANIFPSICFFFFFTPSGNIIIAQLFPLPTFSQGFHSISHFLSCFILKSFYCNDFKSLPSVVLSLPLIPFSTFFMVDFVIFISTGSFYFEFIAFMSLLNMFNISSHISDTYIINVSVSYSTNSMICVISESVSLDWFFSSLQILFSWFFVCIPRM